VVDREISDVRRQLTIDTQLRRRRPRETPMPAQLREVLTEEPPDDPELRLRRWAIVHELVTVELYGPLVPHDDDAASWDPVHACTILTGAPAARPEVPQPFRNGWIWWPSAAVSRPASAMLPRS
jgi:hypothetical protein